MIDSIGLHRIPTFGILQVPDSGMMCLHAFAMPEEPQSGRELRHLVAQNISVLVPAAFGKDATKKGIKEICGASGIANGTVGRIVTPGANSWNISFLAPLAKALNVPPWQLLLPDLTVTMDGVVVSIEGMKARQWPFASVRREDVEDLTADELARLEKTIAARISELKGDRPKSNTTDKEKRRRG